MKFRAIFYPLICVAIVFAIAAFLIIKNYHPNNSTAHVETAITTDNSNNSNNKTNNGSNNTTGNDSTSEDDNTQTLNDGQCDNPNDNQENNQSDNNTSDQTDDEDNDNSSQDNTTDHNNQSQDCDESGDDDTSTLPANPNQDDTKNDSQSGAQDNPNDDDNEQDNQNDDDDEEDDCFTPILPVDDAKIVLANYNSNIIITNKDVFCLKYEIIEGNKQYLNQDIDVIIENQDICTLMMQGAPFIYLQKQGNGKTTVKIVSVNNPNIFITITIIFN